MRICLHTYYEIADPYIGGTQTLLVKLAKELNVLGHEAFIVCSSMRPHFNVEGVDVYGVIPKKHIPLLRNKYQGIASSKFLKDAIVDGNNIETALKQLAEYSFEQYSRYKADIYHLNAYVAALAQNLQTPIVAYQHENEEEFDGFLGNGAFACLVRLTKMCNNQLDVKHMLFTASQYYAQRFSERLDIPIQSVHLGVLLNDMMRSKAVQYTETTCFNRTSDSIVVLIPSRFNIKQKGQDLAIVACEKLLKQYPLELVFSGIKSSLKTELEEFRDKYRNLKISNHIHFIAVQNMSDLYGCSHIVLSPERYCSYGLSISESLAMGIPTILSDIPTYHEIAYGYEHAFFFKTNDLNDLEMTLKKAIIKAADRNFRYVDSSVEFRINNDIRTTAVAFSKVYKELLQ